MTNNGRRVWTVLGGMIAGAGLGLGARALLLDYADLVVVGGVLLGLGVGIMVALARWNG